MIFHFRENCLTRSNDQEEEIEKRQKFEISLAVSLIWLSKGIGLNLKFFRISKILHWKLHLDKNGSVQKSLECLLKFEKILKNQNQFQNFCETQHMDPKKIQKTVKLLDLGIDEELLPKGSKKSDDEAIELLQ